MRLRLLIADTRPEILAIWSDVFCNIKDISVVNTDTHALAASAKIDAELLTGWLAHERYGGKPSRGISQILSTGGEAGMPPWVVTTSPFAAHLEKTIQPNGSKEVILVQDQVLTPEEEDHIVFGKVFESIDQFNESNEDAKIQTLGFDLKLLNIPRGDPRKEAEAIRSAYVERYGIATNASE